MNRVERVGDAVRRPTAFWSPAVHGLLRYLESVDFPAPRVLQVAHGTELLTWIDGESGPAGWVKVVAEDGLQAWGRFLRHYHDFVAGYCPAADSVWVHGIGPPAPGEIICHGDFGPWNSVWRGTEIVGLTDWDLARPAPASFDLAYALEYVAPFRDDESCLRWLRYPAVPDRRRRIELFYEAYGVPVPNDVVGLVAHQQRAVLETCKDLACLGIEPQATWVNDGYLDVLWSRVRWTESLEL